MELFGTPWNSLELSEIPWNSMEFLGTQWNSMELFGPLRDSVSDVQVPNPLNSENALDIYYSLQFIFPIVLMISYKMQYYFILNICVQEFADLNLILKNLFDFGCSKNVTIVSKILVKLSEIRDLHFNMYETLKVMKRFYSLLILMNLKMFFFLESLYMHFLLHK